MKNPLNRDDRAGQAELEGMTIRFGWPEWRLLKRNPWVFDLFRFWAMPGKPKTEQEWKDATTYWRNE